MQHEDRVRILHMIEAADAVAQFVAGRSRDDLEEDRMLLFALAHAIERFWARRRARSLPKPGPPRHRSLGQPSWECATG